MALTSAQQQQMAIDAAVVKAKEDYAKAAAAGNKAAMEKAHAAAEAERAKAASIGYTTYNANKDTLDYSTNYSPGESTNRPPASLDWDDDGKVDSMSGGNTYDASGNQLNVGNTAGWYVNPNAWDYNGANNGGFDPSKPTYSGGSSSSSYTPSRPAAPSAPPVPRSAPAFAQELQQELVKYEYLYGVKDLRIIGNEFAPASVYVSKPMQIDGNVMQVSLNSSEDHPVFNSITGEAAERQTAVEYYISYLENPTVDDWHPILPDGQKEIPCELLIFDTARTASLRFPALTYSDLAPKVYRDGIEYDDWAFNGGGTAVQLTGDITVGSIYTIRYTPNAEIVDPWVIDIYQQGLRTAKQVDVFPDGTNHNRTLNLSKYPYVNYEMINTDAGYDPNTSTYRPINVSLSSGSIAGKDRKILKDVPQYTGTTVDAAMKNITDYKTREWKVPQAYSLDKTAPYYFFDYWHEGSKLYFSETFNKADILTNQDTNHGNAAVSVEYDYLVAFFRIKIVMRRTGPGINSVSPSVNQYSLKFKTMK
jgi:hypothetical protein